MWVRRAESLALEVKEKMEEKSRSLAREDPAEQDRNELINVKDKRREEKKEKRKQEIVGGGHMNLVRIYNQTHKIKEIRSIVGS